MRYIRIENKEQAEAIDSLEFCLENLCYNNGGSKIERQDEAMDKVENYLWLNDKYIKEGDALLTKEDYVQASEKFWGAAAEVVKAIAAKRGADIQSHGGLFRFITMLSKELNDSELLRSFSLAGALHQNFYENWLTSEIVVDHSKAVKSLVKKLEKLAR